MGNLFGIGGVLERDGLYASLTRKICDTFYLKQYFCRVNYLELAGPVKANFLPLVISLYILFEKRKVPSKACQ